MQAEPAARPAWASCRQGRVSLPANCKPEGSILLPSHPWGPCCPRRFHHSRHDEEPETLHWKTVDLADADANAVACMRPAGAKIRSQRGRLACCKRVDFPGRPSHRPSRGRRRRRIGGMPILTESEVAKSRRQAHDNDACGFAHGTIAHRGMHPCHAAKLRRDRALRDQRRDGDERGTVMRGVMSGTGGPISGEGCWLRPDQWRTWCYGIFRCRVPAGRAREARHVFTSGVMTIDA
jgi:hypothetical protein